jgi:uncharacterized protein (TIGR02996 family)
MHDQLLRAVLDAPHDMAPRLIFSDWLEENGWPCRADYIRRSIAGPYRPADRMMWIRDCDRPHIMFGKDAEDLEGEGRDWRNRMTWSNVPEGEACDFDLSALGQPVARLAAFYDWRGVCFPGHDRPSRWPGEFATTLCRGFPEWLRISTRLFMKYADTIFSTYPIIGVQLIDREPQKSPVANQNVYRFTSDSIANPVQYAINQILKCELPREIAPFEGSSCFYSGYDEAIAALSKSCVAYGRAQAKLSPL